MRQWTVSRLLVSLAFVAATSCASKQNPATPATAAPAGNAPTSAKLEMHAIVLPGGTPEGIRMDYIAFDATTGFVWVPAGLTGSVDVIDSATEVVTRIEGFPTAEVERNGYKRVVGPSAAMVGEGVVYVGNRADSTVCAVDAKTLKKGTCGKLDSMPDGVAYVASTKEVWVTMPRDNSIAILDANTLVVKQVMKFDGQPEGYAVDNERGLFYTNLEDKDKALAINIRERRVVSTWEPQCGEDGPKCLALDHASNFLMLACPDHVKVFDVGHESKLLSKIDTGAGVDSIDYNEQRRELYVGAADAAMLTIAKLDDKGILSLTSQTPTSDGARNPVASPAGVVYLTDSELGRILVVK